MNGYSLKTSAVSAKRRDARACDAHCAHVTALD